MSKIIIEGEHAEKLNEIAETLMQEKNLSEEEAIKETKEIVEARLYLNNFLKNILFKRCEEVNKIFAENFSVKNVIDRLHEQIVEKKSYEEIMNSER